MLFKISTMAGHRMSTMNRIADYVCEAMRERAEVYRIAKELGVDPTHHTLLSLWGLRDRRRHEADVEARARRPQRTHSPSYLEVC